MAIRKRRGASGLAYQVYWKNPYTGAQECKTFHTLAEARKHDSLIKHQLQFETDLFKPEALVREGADRTVEDAVFLYLRDKKFPEKQVEKYLTALRLPLQHYGHILLIDFSSESWDELTKKLRCTSKSRGVGLISSAFVHDILSKLRTVIRWAHERGMIESLPRMKVPDRRSSEDICGSASASATCNHSWHDAGLESRAVRIAGFEMEPC